MGEFKATPGPWFIDPDAPPFPGGIEGIAIAATVDGKKLGLCLAGFKTPANARLIAAAPDLLAACETVRRGLGFPHGNELPDWQMREVLDAAIAKVRG